MRVVAAHSRASPPNDPRQPSRNQHPRRTRAGLSLVPRSKHLTLNLLPQVPLQVPLLALRPRERQPERPAANDVFVREEVGAVAEIAEEGGGPAAVEGREGEGADEREEGGSSCR